MIAYLCVVNTNTTAVVGLIVVVPVFVEPQLNDPLKIKVNM